MSFDHLFANHEFLPADVHRLVRNRLERVNVIEVNAIEFIDRGLDVARHGEIDAKKRAVGTRAHDRRELRGGENVVRRGG